MKKSKHRPTKLVSFIIAVITIVLAIFLSICLYKQHSLEIRFGAIIQWLSNLEEDVAGLTSDGMMLVCIFALYIARCQLPIPVSILCAITGMCFSLNKALIINVVFFLFFFIVKYTEGRLMGAASINAVLNIPQLGFIKQWVTYKGSGNPYILAVSRVLPVISVGMVSKLYGSMKYDFLYFLCLSILGFMPRLYVYTALGTSIYNPFSRQFIILILIAVIFTGVTTLLFNLFYGIRSNKMNQTLLIYSQKGKYRVVL